MVNLWHNAPLRKFSDFFVKIICMADIFTNHVTHIDVGEGLKGGIIAVSLPQGAITLIFPL